MILPNEMWWNIFIQLPIGYLIKMRLVCHHWMELIDSLMTNQKIDKQGLSLLALLVQNNDPTIEILLSNTHSRFRKKIMYYYAYYGNVTGIRACIRHGLQWNEKCTSYAVHGKKLLYLKKYFKRNIDILEDSHLISQMAAFSGDTGLLKWIHNESPNYNLVIEVINNAIENNQLQTIKWILRKKRFEQQTFCTIAAKNGHLKLIKHFMEHNYFPTKHTLCLIIKYLSNCHMDEKWIMDQLEHWIQFQSTWYERGGIHIANTSIYFNASPKMTSSAATGQNIIVLKWLRENGCPCDNKTCANASRYGRFETLKWANEMGCTWDEWVCFHAARHGHFEILKWALENDCPCDDRVCMFAAKGGSLEILQWLLEYGFQFPHNAFPAVITNKNFHLVKWLIQQGIPCNEYIMVKSTNYCDIELVQWTLQKSITWFPSRAPKIFHQYYTNICRYGNVHVLESIYQLDSQNWLDQSFDECLTLVVEHNQSQMFDWLINHLPTNFFPKKSCSLRTYLEKTICPIDQSKMIILKTNQKTWNKYADLIAELGKPKTQCDLY